MKILLAIVLACPAVPGVAADYQPLQGEYAIGGKTLLDAPPAEPQNTHLYIDLEGRAARDLYEALPGKAAAGVCGEPDALTKRSGGVQCTRESNGKQYHCAFGVELRTQRVVSGVVC